MWIDGTTYVLLAAVTALAAAMGSDEAAKWLEPKTLFWVRTWCTVASGSLLAIKLFRSTSYANHLTSTIAEQSSSSQSQASIPVVRVPVVMTSTASTSSSAQPVATTAAPLTPPLPNT